MGKFNIKQFVWGIVIGIITVGLMFVSYRVGFDSGEEKVKGEEVVVDQEELYITVKTDCSDVSSDENEEGEEVKRYCASYNEGESAFEVMKRVEEENEVFTFAYEESDFGVFVTSVNNYHPDTESKFWSFLINGEMSMVGVSDYEVLEGDELGFKVEEVVF
jgi:hypothetical protein